MRLAVTVPGLYRLVVTGLMIFFLRGPRLTAKIMCDKCGELDEKIAHLRSVGARITDEKTIAGVQSLIEECLAERAKLHADQTEQP